MAATVLSALATAFILIPGAIVGVSVGASVHESLPWYIDDRLTIVLSAIPAVACMLLAGSAWGAAISRITGRPDGKRMALAGGIAFAPAAITVTLALGALESLIVEQQRGPALPLHNVFTILFVPSAALIAGVCGAAMGLATRDGATASRLGLTSALAAAAAFLGVNLAMDTLGWRVGAPGAAERATMLLTTLLGDVAAALAGGAVIGRTLSRGHDRASTRY